VFGFGDMGTTFAESGRATVFVLIQRSSSFCLSVFDSSGHGMVP
jgi:hypothetical protein